MLLIGLKFASSNQKPYTDLGSDTSSLCNFFSAAAPQTSFRKETNGGVAICQLFSQTNEEDLGLTFKISLTMPTMVCDLPVPGGPCNMQIRGIGNAMCTAFVAMEIAFAWNSLYS